MSEFHRARSTITHTNGLKAKLPPRPFLDLWKTQVSITFMSQNTKRGSLRSARAAPAWSAWLVDIALVANGGLDNPQHAEHVLNDGADIVALGKGALANPDYPTRLLMNQPMKEFDFSLLGPIANIKNSELA